MIGRALATFGHRLGRSTVSLPSPHDILLAVPLVAASSERQHQSDDDDARNHETGENQLEGAKSDHGRILASETGSSSSLAIRNCYNAPMTRRFQFSLARLFAFTTLMAAAVGTLLAARRCEPLWNLAVLVLACGVCGAAFGTLFHRTIIMLLTAVLGLFAGTCFVGFLICASDL